jgi:phosphoribosylformimino-5-aminoimidazole carboxamide ribotide isomerase
MLIIPAIDLFGGNIVRLRRGEENTAVTYSTDPIRTALEFQESGASWIHVVDLNGAFGKPGLNDTVIIKLIQNLKIPLQLGGGIRSLDRIDFWLNHGIKRIILGSVAVKNFKMVRTAVEKHGREAIIVGVDVRKGKVSIHGWQKNTNTDAIHLARRMRSIGLIRAVVTDILSDGMLSGPKLHWPMEIARKTGLSVIVSGGIQSLDDLTLIASEGRHCIEGTIVGRALYEKKFTLREAIDRIQA